jgi:multidrug transporter EmrE-like cation transporter
MRYWIDNHLTYLFVLGIMVYVVGEVIMALSFRYQNIAVASILTVIFNILALSILSYFMFGDKLNLLAIIGIIMGLVSVTILEISTFTA